MIFVDTSYWVALRNRRDAHHREALELMRQHSAALLVTSNLVRGETWTFLRRRSGHTAAVGFLDVLDRAARLRLMAVELAHEEDAFRWLRRHDEREYSYVDATSFMLMQDLGISQALAFDGDFSAAGFVELRP